MGQGLVGGVGKREGDVFRTEAGGNGGGLSVELNGWTLAFGTDNFDVAPADTAAPSGAESFHAGFFSGETGGVAFEASGFGFAVLDFTFGENAVEKTIAETLDGLADARNFGDIDTGAEDHFRIVIGGGPRASRFELNLRRVVRGFALDQKRWSPRYWSLLFMSVASGVSL